MMVAPDPSQKSNSASQAGKPWPTASSSRCFPQFMALPTEIRHLIWELFLAASPRIHVVHETGPPPASRTPHRHEVLSYAVTTLDAATNRRTSCVRSAFVNHECLGVARRLKLFDNMSATSPLQSQGDGGGGGDDDDDDGATSSLTWEFASGGGAVRVNSGSRGTCRPFARIGLATDLQQLQSSPMGPGWAGEPRSRPRSAKKSVPHKADERLVDVDWQQDLIFICSPSNEQAFRNLAEVEWINKVQRLAVLVPRRCESNIPFGPGFIVSQTLRPMTRLKEIYVVMIPFTKPMPDPTSAGNSWGRDRYGFVSYVDYLKEVGITTKEMSQERHMTYQRTALSMMQAVSEHLEMPGITLRKVVDIDCNLFTENTYGRRERWRWMSPDDNRS